MREDAAVISDGVCKWILASKAAIFDLFTSSRLCSRGFHLGPFLGRKL